MLASGWIHEHGGPFESAGEGTERVLRPLGEDNQPGLGRLRVLIQDCPAHVRPAQERDVPERMLLKEPRPDRVGQHPLQEFDLAVEGRRSRAAPRAASSPEAGPSVCVHLPEREPLRR
jgi:hypothetical protein